MTVSRQYFIVDAFASRPFTGNPAAVVPLDTWRDDIWLQNVAMEMNLSDTAFLVPNASGYDLRWFTPRVEIDLCGHATLASAVVLSHLGKLANGSQVAFATRSGALPVIRHGQRFQLDFPVKPEEPAEPPTGLLESLNAQPIYVGRNKFDYLVQVDTESAVRKMSPDFTQLAKVNCRGIVVTGPSSDPTYDFVSRFFAPAAGINEDPVTGSAHCCLADFWGKRLGKSSMVGFQASARGGIVQLELQGDQRVLLSGQGVLVATGEILA